jgi:hypothetical protein
MKAQNNHTDFTRIGGKERAAMHLVEDVDCPADLD